MEDLFSKIDKRYAPKNSVTIRTNVDRVRHQAEEEQRAAELAQQKQTQRIVKCVLLSCLAGLIVVASFVSCFVLEDGQIKPHYESSRNKLQREMQEYTQIRRDEATKRLEELRREHLERVESEKLKSTKNNNKTR